MGVTLAVTLLVLSMMVVSLLLAGTALVTVLGWQVRPESMLILSIVIIAAPRILINVLDRKFTDRSRESGLLRKSIAGGFNFYARVGFADRGGVLGVLASHHGRWRVRLVTTVAMMLCVLGAVFSQFAMRSPNRLGTYASFPQFEKSSTQIVDAAHYEDQRETLGASVVPFVQSAVIDGNYLKLVIPYQPDRDSAGMRRRCPGALTIADADARAESMLSCLAALHSVSLDGKLLSDQRFDAGSDARSERPALVAMIDVRALAPGRHEITIARVPVLGDDGKPESAKPWAIPFWR